MALNQEYHKLWFESFVLESTSGHRDAVALRLTRDQSQNLPEEVETECDNRSLDPSDLLLECSKDLRSSHPPGTKFLFKAKLTDREGERPFFYTNYHWKPEIVEP
ncbi:hypothetical protein [Candidatus Electronema sp. JC]|uniref:hypothetical protein n=1 Tax=Candidatus Electronema sp. JC TaxID=3401570 RepID=UPI003B434453